MGRKGYNKTQAIKIHARQRANHRLGLPDKAVKEMEYAIREGRAFLVHKQSNTRGIYRVPYEGQWYYAVYDKSRHLIVTFFTELPEYATG